MFSLYSDAPVLFVSCREGSHESRPSSQSSRRSWACLPPEDEQGLIAFLAPGSYKD